MAVMFTRYSRLMRNTLWALKQRDVRTVKLNGKCTVTCETGRVWLTHEVEADVVLEAGQSAHIVLQGLLVVEALERAVVAIS